jgi:hypothetical protein
MANIALALPDSLCPEPVQNYALSPSRLVPRGLQAQPSLGGRPILPVPAKSLEQFRLETKWPALQAPALPMLSGGLRRGAIVELLGRRSAGRTAALLHILACATSRGEVCAVVDTDDNFHPASAAEAGVELERLVWVRCRGNTEHAMRAADLLLHAGGMGVVVLDLCEVSTRVLNRIPLSYWFRFQRAIEGTPSILVVGARVTQARSCAAHVMELERKQAQWSGGAPFRLLQGMETMARIQRPAQTLSAISCQLSATPGKLSAISGQLSVAPRKLSAISDQRSATRGNGQPSATPRKLIAES